MPASTPNHEHLAPAPYLQPRRKMGWFTKLLLSLAFLIVLAGVAAYLLSSFIITALVDDRFRGTIGHAGQDIINLAHPDAYYYGAKLVNSQVNGNLLQWRGQFDYDLRYQAKGDPEPQLLRVIVYADQGFYFHQQVHHAQLGRDTGTPPRPETNEKLEKLLSR